MSDESTYYRVYHDPGLNSSSLLVGWEEDTGSLGSRVIDYLISKLNPKIIADIPPVGFFSLVGVAVHDDVIRFPEAKFYVLKKKRLVFFKGNAPDTEWYRFLTAVLDVGENHCSMKEVFTIGGMLSTDPHTAPRGLLAIANGPEMKKLLRRYNIDSDMSYQSSGGQRPTLNSFLSWMAAQRHLPGANLWAPTPYYLASVDDPRAVKIIAGFINTKFRLNLDLGDLDEAISRQEAAIARLSASVPEIGNIIKKLENNVPVSEEENGKLIFEIRGALKNQGSRG